MLTCTVILGTRVFPIYNTNNCHFQNYCSGAGDEGSPEKLPAYLDDSEFSETVEMGLGQEETFP